MAWLQINIEEAGRQTVPRMLDESGFEWTGNDLRRISGLVERSDQRFVEVQSYNELLREFLGTNIMLPE